MVDVASRSSLIHDEEGLAQGRNLGAIGWPLLCVAIAAIFTLPALLRPSASGKLHFNSEALVALNSVRPGYVLIGDSMLGTRINPQLLNSLVGHDCCYMMWSGGSASAWWYLALKNYALAADRRPRRVFIFFRDYFLTEPTYRTQDNYWWRIQRMSHEDEPELMRALRARQSWQDGLEQHLAQLYPVQSRRDQARYFPDWLAARAVARTPIRYGDDVSARYEASFELGKLRPMTEADTGASDDSDPALDFDANLESSLLPPMLEQAKRVGVELVFVRVQRRPAANGPPPQSPRLLRYISSLKAYLQANGGKWYDFTGDPELTLDRYLDGDHIRPEARDLSTRLFVTRLQPYLQ